MAIDTSGLGKFAGPAWAVTETFAYTCSDGTSGTEYPDYTLTFTALGLNDLSMSVVGCDLRFTVNGDTATLSNAPVRCVAVQNPIVNSYTATSRDGRNLVIGSQQSETLENGTTCSATVMGTGTR